MKHNPALSALEVLIECVTPETSLLRIVTQSPRIVRGSGKVFKAKNGIVLKSCFSPGWDQVYNTLFLRGTETELDNEKIHIPADQLPRIKDAIHEFNTYMGCDQKARIPTKGPNPHIVGAIDTFEVMKDALESKIRTIELSIERERTELKSINEAIAKMKKLIK